MGIFSFINNKNKRSASSAQSSLSNIGEIVSKVKYVDSYEKAMNVAVAFACVRLITDTMATLPLQYKVFAKEKKIFIPYDFSEGEALSYALAVRPNKYMSAYDFRKTIGWHLLVRGNAYIVWRNNELILLNPDYVTFEKMENKYIVNDPWMKVFGEFAASDIIHIKHNSTDGGFKGSSVISHAMHQLSLANTASNQTLERLGKGGIGKFIVGNKDDATGSLGDNDDDELLNFAEDLQKQIAEGNDALVARGQVSVTNLGWSASDLQALAQEQWSAQQICYFFGVPPQKIGLATTNSNYKSVDAANVAFFSETIKPLLDNIESEFNNKLIQRDVWKYYKFQHDTSALYLTDLMTRADWIKKRIESGTLTINEARKMEDLSPVDGGDDVLVSTNMANIQSSKITNQQTQQ